ncbi:hypothetical protein [Streptomyces sp. NPDC093149]|uniref:hypothetical protein n=1 Tax=Streptomyces sp. NPDC093149 TaxID=3366031 RepID=UPI0038117B41
MTEINRRHFLQVAGATSGFVALSGVQRYQPFFTDQPAATLRAEREHRHHAVIEQVIADTKAGAQAHLPSGRFHADVAWL